MKILVYKGEHGRMYWDASTKEKEQAALRCLFKLLDDLRSYETSAEVNQNEISICEQRIKELKQLEAVKDSLPSILLEETEKKLSKIKRLEDRILQIREDMEWYEKAKSGDIKYIYRLLKSRQYFEYEEWEFVEAVNPLENKNGN